MTRGSRENISTLVNLIASEGVTSESEEENDNDEIFIISSDDEDGENHRETLRVMNIRFYVH